MGALVVSATGVTAWAQRGDSVIVSAAEGDEGGLVRLFVDDEEVGRLAVEVVPHESVAGVRLERAALHHKTLEPQVRARDQGEALVATAVTADGRPALGATFTFFLEGREIASAAPGEIQDVLLYTPAFCSPHTVRARLGPHEDEEELWLDPESVLVVTTVPEPVRASCDTAGGGAPLLSLLCLLAALGRRRGGGDLAPRSTGEPRRFSGGCPGHRGVASPEVCPRALLGLVLLKHNLSPRPPRTPREGRPST